MQLLIVCQKRAYHLAEFQYWSTGPH